MLIQLIQQRPVGTAVADVWFWLDVQGDVQQNTRVLPLPSHLMYRLDDEFSQIRTRFCLVILVRDWVVMQPRPQLHSYCEKGLVMRVQVLIPSLMRCMAYVQDMIQSLHLHVDSLKNQVGSLLDEAEAKDRLVTAINLQLDIRDKRIRDLTKQLQEAVGRLAETSSALEAKSGLLSEREQVCLSRLCVLHTGISADCHTCCIALRADDLSFESSPLSISCKATYGGSDGTMYDTADQYNSALTEH